MVNCKTERKKVNSKVVEKICETCGETAINSMVCLRCGKLVCDKCAKFNLEDRYCPTCYEKIRKLYKLV